MSDKTAAAAMDAFAVSLSAFVADGPLVVAEEIKLELLLISFAAENDIVGVLTSVKMLPQHLL